MNIKDNIYNIVINLLNIIYKHNIIEYPKEDIIEIVKKFKEKNYSENKNLIIILNKLEIIQELLNHDVVSEHFARLFKIGIKYDNSEGAKKYNEEDITEKDLKEIDIMLDNYLVKIRNFRKFKKIDKTYDNESKKISTYATRKSKIKRV